MRIRIAAEGETWKTAIGEGTIEDVNVVKWKSGKVYVQYLLKDAIELLVKDMHKNIEDGYDNVVIVEGPEGSGKSNIAWRICHAYDPLFDILKQYTYNTDSWKDKLQAGGDMRSVFWMDEGSNMANNRDWNTTDNKNLIGLLETCRSRGWTIVMCIPTHERLDVYIREHRIRYLIRCGPMSFSKTGHLDRGYFEIRKKTPWGKLETVAYGRYDKMPDDVKATYEAIKLDSQRKLIDQVINPESNGSKYKAKYEEKSRQMDEIMMRLVDGGTMDRDAVMRLFGFTNESTFRNHISNARKRANNGED